jgi:hypothetical protein
MCLGCWSQQGLINDDKMKAVTKLPTVKEESLAEEKRGRGEAQVQGQRGGAHLYPYLLGGLGNCAGTGMGMGTGGGPSTCRIPVAITRSD